MWKPKLLVYKTQSFHIIESDIFTDFTRKKEEKRAWEFKLRPKVQLAAEKEDLEECARQRLCYLIISSSEKLISAVIYEALRLRVLFPPN